MPALLDQVPEPLATTDTESAIAKKAAAKLEAIASANQDVTIHLEGASNVAIPLPAKAVRLMLKVLQAMAEQKALSVIPHEAELTTKQAADFLNVSRPFVCKLIDEEKLPARKVNRHRRVRFSDLVAFEQKSRTERNEALADLAKLSEELDLE